MSTYTPDADLDLVLERTVPVPPEKVWEAWTRPELLVQWFTPAPWKTVDVDLDVRPGGLFSSTMESPEGERFPNAGCILQVEDGRLLVFTSTLAADFRPLPPSGEPGDLPFTARVEITPSDDGGTHYRAVALHADADGKAQHEAMGFTDGWGAALDQMVALIQG